MAPDKFDYQHAFATVFTHAEDLLLRLKSHPDALTQYFDSWAAIAEKAEEVDNLALQDVILLFIEACSWAFKKTNDADTLTTAQWQLFKKWHNLFASYLHTPDDSDIILALIKCLNDPLLSIGLESEDEQLLLDSFLPVIEQLTAHRRQNSASNPEEFSIWEKLSVLFNEVELNFQETLALQTNTSDDAYSESLKHYLMSWSVIAKIIYTENNEALAKLLNLILLFLDFNSQLFNLPDSLNNQQQALLRQWHHLFNDYIKAKGSQQLAVALVKCLGNPHWPQPLSEEEEEILMADFAITQPSPSALLSDIEASEVVCNPKTAEIIEEAPPNAVEKTTFASQDPENSIWQNIESVFNQAADFLRTAIESESIHDPATFKQGLQDYVQCWQLVADLLATDEVNSGLFNVVLLFSEISNQTFRQLDSLNTEQSALLTDWQNLFAAYLKVPGNRQLAKRLIKCLSNPSWSAPIEAEDEPLLLEEFGLDETAQMPLQTDDQPNWLVDASVNTEKNSIWQKLEPLFNDTQSQLQLMQELLATNTAKFGCEYLQTYAQCWLVMAEIIAEDDENLPTLADVTLLFADNCMELVEQNVALNQNFIRLLQQWHAAFIAYLPDVKAMPQASALIECLESSYWLRPLTTVDRAMLLEMMADETQELSMFAEEDESSLLFSDSWVADDVAMFADESLESDAGEDFALLIEEELGAEEAALPITEPVLTGAEQSEDVAMFADEGWQENLAEDFALLAEAERDSDELSSATSEVVAELSPRPVVPIDPELIGMVRDEFALLAKEFSSEISATTNTPSFKTTLKKHEVKLKSLAKACNSIGFSGLEQVFKHLLLNIPEETDSFSEAEVELFKAVLPLIQNYLAAFSEPDKAVVLVTHLTTPGWKQPLTQAQAEPLIALLSGITLRLHKQELDNRKILAEPADVSLLVPADVNPELLDSLLHELPLLTENFSAVIQQIVSGHGSVQLLLQAQRIAHTLKGSANVIGVAGIAVITHHLEEILEYLGKKEIFPTGALAELLLESADCLEMMSELMLDGKTQPPEQALPVLQKVLDWANQIANAGLPAKNSDADTTPLQALPNTAITSAVPKKQVTEPVTMIRVPTKTIEQLLRTTGAGCILTTQFKQRISHFSDELKTLNHLNWHMQTLVSELDQSIHIQSCSAKTNRSAANIESDALALEPYNELHTAVSRIAEAATDIRDINLHMDEQLLDLQYLLTEEDTIQTESQAILQSMRMVPANTIATRCQRIVKQTCRATHKEVELEIKGGDILLASEILNQMLEPLLHLLRNAVDHGIEPLEVREKANKPKTGKIILEFSRNGNCVVIRCKDDGGGLAREEILQTALQKGLISAQQQLTEAEIHNLILIPGFSTRTVVSQTSGRGIGMDAIQAKISALHGQMVLSSLPGKGLTVEISVPLTSSSIWSLLIKCAEQTLAISNRGLRKIHHADECILVQKEGLLYCEIDRQSYPVKYFAELIGMPITYNTAQKLPALRIEDKTGKTHIVFIETLLSYQDLPVKNMGDYLPHIQGISGAAILANGVVAPVIDLVEMLQ